MKEILDIPFQCHQTYPAAPDERGNQPCQELGACIDHRRQRVAARRVRSDDLEGEHLQPVLRRRPYLLGPHAASHLAQ